MACSLHITSIHSQSLSLSSTMASQNPNPNKPNSLYPEIIQGDPPPFISNPSSSSSSLYPSIDMRDFVENLFPENPHPSAPPESLEEVLVMLPGVILHLIDKQYSVELASGDLSIIRLWQGNNIVAVLARVGQEIQWPLTKDEASVKVDGSHYFFSLRPMKENGSGSDSSDDEGNEGENWLNYGLTIAPEGQEPLVEMLDGILEHYSSFTKVMDVSKEGMEVLEVKLSPLEKDKGLSEERSSAYWTTLAPNVEDYSGTAARLIAAGSGQLVKGILWCGDVTVDRLKWGNEFLKKRMSPASNTEISPQTMKNIKRVQRVTLVTEKVATGVLSGVVKVSGFFTGSVANSRVGKKFFGLLPGEMVLASLDGFGKVCDAVEAAGRNVMSTSSTVTTGLVSHRYGEQAGQATNRGLDAAGHAVGAAWAVFKIRKAFNPKSFIKPTTLAAARAAANEKVAKKSK